MLIIYSNNTKHYINIYILYNICIYYLFVYLCLLYCLVRERTIATETVTGQTLIIFYLVLFLRRKTHVIWNKNHISQVNVHYYFCPLLFSIFIKSITQTFHLGFDNKDHKNRKNGEYIQNIGSRMYKIKPHHYLIFYFTRTFGLVNNNKSKLIYHLFLG